jgi:hypothetical protein
MTSSKILLATLTFGAAVAFAGQASAEKLKATLNGASEVPTNTSKGTGTLDANYDAASKKLSWKLSYSGLSGPATAAHFHGPAAPGVNAGVVVPIGTAGMGNPVTGAAPISDAQAADLAAGKWYVNIHTEKNKGGEIRGQVTSAK